MSPRTDLQFEMIRKNRKDQIIQAALEIFAVEGYYKASIAKIAKKAKVSKGLLYNYFLSKEDLLDAILTLGIEKFHDILTGIDDELDTPEELLQYIKGSFEVMRREPDFYKLYYSVILQQGVSELARGHYREIVDHLMGDISVYFKTKGDTNPVEKAILLDSLLDGIGIHYFLSPDTIDLDKLEKIIFDLFK
jgi:AcrR family transcriptional regulator